MTSNKYQAKTGTAPQQSDCGFSGHRVESNRVSNKMKIDFVQYLKLPLDYVLLPNLLKDNKKVRDRTGRGREGELVGELALLLHFSCKINKKCLQTFAVNFMIDNTEVISVAEKKQ